MYDSVRLTQEECARRYSAAGLVLLGKYVNSNTLVDTMCPVCQKKWKTRPTNVYHGGRGCPDCGRKSSAKARTIDRILIKANLEKSGIITIGDLPNNMNMRAKFSCAVCGRSWTTALANPIYGKGCQKCGNKKAAMKIKMSSLPKLVDYLQNANVELVGDFIGMKSKTKFKCKQCGDMWDASPQNIIAGHGCPFCCKYKSENEVYQMLKDAFGVRNVKRRVMVASKPRRFADFVVTIPNSHSIWVEYDGCQHFAPVKHFGGQEKFNEQKKRDESDCSLSKIIGMPLYRIPYFANKQLAIQQISNEILGI